MAERRERITAVKIDIRSLVEAPFIVKEQEPSYVESERGKVGRANVIAVVVDKPSSSSLVLDDATDRIETRTFDNMMLFENVMVGDIVLLIGRPREYRGKRYLVAEIAKRLGTPTWIALRKRELGRPLPSKVETKKRAEKAEPAPKTGEDFITQIDTILSTIKELDTGSGAPVEDVLERSKAPESALTTLIAEGEVFEIRPGRVKVLE